MTFSARSSEYGLSGLEKTDFHAGSKYYRFIKQRFEQSVGLSKELNTYPDPVDHCYVCDWWSVCNDRRRADDHLSFVAGISRLQVNQLRSWSIPTLSDLA